MSFDFGTRSWGPLKQLIFRRVLKEIIQKALRKPEPLKEPLNESYLFFSFFFFLRNFNKSKNKNNIFFFHPGVSQIFFNSQKKCNEKIISSRPWNVWIQKSNFFGMSWYSCSGLVMSMSSRPFSKYYLCAQDTLWCPEIQERGLKQQPLWAVLVEHLLMQLRYHVTHLSGVRRKHSGTGELMQT